MPDTSKRRGRPKAVPDGSQRIEIVEIASMLFLDRGYGKTTMGDIATSARVSLATIYRFFPRKTELFAAVVANHRQTMIALPGDYTDLPLEEALARIFQIEIDDRAGRQRDILMTMFLVESRQFPELQPILWEQGPEHSSWLLAGWLREQEALGRVRLADPAITATMIMDVVFGAFSLKTSDAPLWPGGTDRVTYLRHCFTILAKGLQPQQHIDAVSQR